jgi:hypothetical protein
LYQVASQRVRLLASQHAALLASCRLEASTETCTLAPSSVESTNKEE